MKTLGKLARIVGYLNASMVEGKVVKKRKVHGEDLCKEHFNIFQIFKKFKNLGFESKVQASARNLCKLDILHDFCDTLFLNSRPFEIDLSSGEKLRSIQEMIQNHLTSFPGLLLMCSGLKSRTQIWFKDVLFGFVKHIVRNMTIPALPWCLDELLMNWFEEENHNSVKL